MKTINDLNLNNKKVFLRLDLSVPMENQVILDDFKIKVAIPTIKLLLEKNALLIVTSHLGRPNGFEENLSIQPVSEYISRALNVEVIVIDDPASSIPKALIKQANKGKILMLENLRFNKGEMSNSMELASVWASYSDVYINDAFAASHRKHASINSICYLVDDKAIGPLFEKELEVIKKIIDNPENPFLALLGGSKAKDKIEVIASLVEKLDVILVGGTLSFLFLEAKGVKTSNKFGGLLSSAKYVINAFKVRDKKLFLPVDFVLENGKTELVTGSEFKHKCFDIGPATIKLFSEQIKRAKTIFSNGPVGKFEDSRFENGTKSLLQEISKSEALCLIGGGDSSYASKKI